MFYVYMQVNTNEPIEKARLEFDSGPHKTVEDAKQAIIDEAKKHFTTDSGETLDTPLEEWGGPHLIMEVVGKFKPVPTIKLSMDLEEIE